MRMALFTDSYTPYVSGVVALFNVFHNNYLLRGMRVYIFALIILIGKLMEKFRF